MNPLFSAARPGTWAARRLGSALDRSIGLLIFVTVCLGAFHATSRVPDSLYEPVQMDAWFGADLPRRHEALSSIASEVGDAYKHPAFKVLSLPVAALGAVFDLKPAQSIRLVCALNAALWAVLVHAVLRHITGSRASSLIFTLLALSMASSIYWLPLPETYAFGSVSVMLGAWLVCRKNLRSINAHAGAVAFSAGMTLTNLWAGALASWLKLGNQRAARSVALGLCLVLAIVAVQRSISPQREKSLEISWITADLQHYSSAKPLAGYLVDFFLEPLIPATVIVAEFRAGSIATGKGTWPPSDLRFVTNALPERAEIRLQLTPLPTWLRVAVWGLWLLLLAAGARKAVLAGDRDIGVFIAAGIAIQFALHLVYGTETVLYSLHWSALLVMLAASSVRSCGAAMRRTMLFIALTAAVAALANNLTTASEALAALR